MNRKQKIIVSIVGITIVMLALLGFTYGYYLTNIYGNTNSNSISITTKDLKLVYSDNSAEILTGTTALTPSTDLTSDGAIGTKTFTVTNTGDDNEYSVIVENIEIKNVKDNTISLFNSNDFRYTLTCTKSDGSNCNSVDTQTIFPLTDRVLVSNEIKEDDVHNYTLTLWYIDTGIDQSDDMGKSLQARINIINVSEWEKAKEGTLLYSLRNNNEVVEPLNLVGKNLTTYSKITYSPQISDEINSVDVWSKNYEDFYIFINDIKCTYGTDYSYDEINNWYNLENINTCYYPECHQIMNNQKIYLPEISACKDTTFLGDTWGLSEIIDVQSSIYDENNDKYTYKYKTIGIKQNEEVLNKYNEEAILSSSYDDYGISYYFRGNVNNNFVNYSGMCWRIVRIQGNGTIKLILADENNECNSPLYSKNNDSAINSSTRYAYSDYYANKNFLYTNSKVPAILESWKNRENKKLDTSKLINNEWCNDVSIYSEENFERYDGYFVMRYNFGGEERARNMLPTFSCNLTGINNTKSIKVNEYLSLITLDEAIFAGYTYEYLYFDDPSIQISGNFPSNYLLDNINEYGRYLTMTPLYTDSLPDLFQAMLNSGGTISTDVDSMPAFLIRPVVVLKSDVSVRYDSESQYEVGTYQNPYVVQ